MKTNCSRIIFEFKKDGLRRKAVPLHSMKKLVRRGDLVGTLSRH
jgi:hypothetical protein